MNKQKPLRFKDLHVRDIFVVKRLPSLRSIKIDSRSLVYTSEVSSIPYMWEGVSPYEEVLMLDLDGNVLSPEQQVRS